MLKLCLSLALGLIFKNFVFKSTLCMACMLACPVKNVKYHISILLLGLPVAMYSICTPTAVRVLAPHLSIRLAGVNC